jgi:hypothetical protein
LIVIIEDTERKSTQFDLASIEGLLNRFRDIPDISFVITASPDAKIDFVRLCEHTELIPDLETNTVVSIVSLVREYCRNKFPNDIDPVERGQLLEGPFLFASKYGQWEYQMVRLVNTPRKLKAIIRRFCNAWENLHGEIDIDELLIASCLRVCAPTVFGFLMRRHSDFAHLETKTDDSKKDPDLVKVALKEEWATLGNPSFDLSAAGKLLQMLDSTSRPIFDEPQYRHINAVQEFRSTRKVYRERIFNERLSEEHILDQSVLHEIYNAKSSGDWKQLGKRIEESAEFREAFDHFRGYLSGRVLKREEIWQITRHVFAAIRVKQGVKASRDSDAFFEATQWAKSCFDSLEDYYQSSCDLVIECIPKNLQLAVDIYSMLIMHGGSNQTLSHYGDEVMHSLQNTLSTATPDEIDGAFDELSPSTLHDLTTFNIQSSGQTAQDWRRWGWFGPILLKALKTNHNKFAPQIAYALGMTIDSPDLPPGFLVNQTVLDGIFGMDAETVMAELSKPFVINPAMKHFGTVGLDFSLVNIRAQKWLKKNRP